MGSLLAARGLAVRVQLALVTAAGITLLMSGLLAYDTTAGVSSTAPPNATTVATAGPTATATVGQVILTPTPIRTGSPAASSSPPSTSTCPWSRRRRASRTATSPST